MGYVFHLASEIAAGSTPFPRRQDLPPEAYVIGRPPSSQRAFVVSHAWESQFHPCPGGEKIVRLATQLRAQDASTDDMVFLDYGSLAQMGRAVPQSYWDSLGASVRDQQSPMQKDRSPKEHWQFSQAMHQMLRLYSCQRCEVLVLPTMDDPSTFPDGADLWGWHSENPYEHRGWCATEYAIARMNGRIVNGDDDAVQAVDCCRVWPTDIASYNKMMAGVDFTSRGDRATVVMLFFRFCFDLREKLGLGQEQSNPHDPGAKDCRQGRCCGCRVS